jgi:hypothetical protein
VEYLHIYEPALPGAGTDREIVARLAVSPAGDAPRRRMPHLSPKERWV